MKKFQKTKTKNKKSRLMFASLLAFILVGGILVVSLGEKSFVQKKLGKADYFSQYSGNSDTEDGIVLSACGSASISAPAPGSLFSHNAAIRFTGIISPDSGSRVARFCWNSDPNDICFDGDISRSSTFTDSYETVGRHAVNFSGRFEDEGGLGVYQLDDEWPRCTLPACVRGCYNTGAAMNATSIGICPHYVPHVEFYTGYDLRLNVAGVGGKITATPEGEASYTTTASRTDPIMPVPTNHRVTLQAAPISTTAEFRSWSGDIGTCAPTNATCIVPMSQDRNITATFGPTGPCTPDCETDRPKYCPDETWPGGCGVTCTGGTKNCTSCTRDCETDRPFKCPNETWSDGCEGTCSGGTKDCESASGWKEVNP